MDATWLDWAAIGVAVAGAAVWLGLRVRRNLRRPKESTADPGACGAACEGCVFAKRCGPKRG